MSTPPRRLAEEPERNADRVDTTLIRWMLGLSPSQRLQVLQDHVGLVSQLRRGQATD